MPEDDFPVTDRDISVLGFQLSTWADEVLASSWSQVNAVTIEFYLPVAMALYGLYYNTLMTGYRELEIESDVLGEEAQEVLLSIANFPHFLGLNADATEKQTMHNSDRNDLLWSSGMAEFFTIFHPDRGPIIDPISCVDLLDAIFDLPLDEQLKRIASWESMEVKYSGRHECKQIDEAIVELYNSSIDHVVKKRAEFLKAAPVLNHIANEIFLDEINYISDGYISPRFLLCFISAPAYKGNFPPITSASTSLTELKIFLKRFYGIIQQFDACDIFDPWIIEYKTNIVRAHQPIADGYDADPWDDYVGAFGA